MNTILILLVVLLGANFFVEPNIEKNITYCPMKEMQETPKSINIPYEDFFLKTDNGKMINGWYIKKDGATKVLLYFHGNAGNLGQNLSFIKEYFKLPVNLCFIDYNGYGKSEGEPSEKNLYADAKAAYDYLIQQKGFAPKNIIVAGCSLGGAVAVDLASKEQVGGVVIESTFTSLRDEASQIMPGYYRPFLWMMKESYDSIGKIDKINAPLLVIHSKEDQSVPYSMAVELYNKAHSPKKLLLLDKGGHNDFAMTEDVLNNLRECINGEFL